LKLTGQNENATPSPNSAKTACRLEVSWLFLLNESSLTIVPSDLKGQGVRFAPMGLLCDGDWAIFGLR